jgi:hypothetical protein
MLPGNKTRSAQSGSSSRRAFGSGPKWRTVRLEDGGRNDHAMRPMPAHATEAAELYKPLS